MLVLVVDGSLMYNS